MTTDDDSQVRASIHTAKATVWAAIIGVIGLLIGTIVGPLVSNWLGNPENNLEKYEFEIKPDLYPFEMSEVEIRQGDTVEIIVLGANSSVLNCGIGETTVMGMVNHEYEPLSALPTENLCALIGRIDQEPAPYFFVGGYTKFVSDIEGILYLGLNDVVPEYCSFPDCFVGNTGRIYVRVLVTRK
jgi:hypothetical protein